MAALTASSAHSQAIRAALIGGPRTAAFLCEKLGLSQPTFSRALRFLGDEVLRLGAARSIQYALRDGRRLGGGAPVYRVDAQGQVHRLGQLVPVWPDGHVLQPDPQGPLASASPSHHEGVPWWLQDMRPQGFLGRAFVAQHAQRLGLPAQLQEWSDAHALEALLRQGQDAVGNLLLGDAARDAFVHSPPPQAIALTDRATRYALYAEQALRGDLPGSSAGGEQPKFLAYAEAPSGPPRHVLVKFSLPTDEPVSRRWRDLLLAEHLALQTLQEAGVPSAHSELIDQGPQRFLELARFDRSGALGRHALISLAALEAEFIGRAHATWPELTQQLAQARHIRPEAAEMATLLYAFGHLIGNTDMHHGNLSFLSDRGRPYALAPAYDMLPMGLAPRSGGALPEHLPEPQLRALVPNAVWHQAMGLAQTWWDRLAQDPRQSPEWAVAQAALGRHLERAQHQLARLA